MILLRNIDLAFNQSIIEKRSMKNIIHEIKISFVCFMLRFIKSVTTYFANITIILVKLHISAY